MLYISDISNYVNYIKYSYISFAKFTCELSRFLGFNKFDVENNTISILNR